MPKVLPALKLLLILLAQPVLLVLPVFVVASGCRLLCLFVPGGIGLYLVVTCSTQLHPVVQGCTWWYPVEPGYTRFHLHRIHCHLILDYRLKLDQVPPGFTWLYLVLQIVLG